MSAFKTYINLAISDSAHTMYLRTNFSSFRIFSNFITGSLKNNSYIEVSHLIDPTIDEVKYIFGFSDSEATKYVINYYMNNLWEIYLKPTILIRNHFGKFLLD